MARRNTKTASKAKAQEVEATVEQEAVQEIEQAAEDVVETKEPEKIKPEKPKLVKAVMRMTWPGLGTQGNIIELEEHLAKQYAELGVVDTAPNAIKNAKKA